MQKYSVLMSVYKKEKAEYLRLAVDSMLHQTIKPEQIVIVEDGPLTNELYEVIAEYLKNEPNIFTIVKNEKNLGLGISLNRGLAVCRNELVARMDTDDISLSHRCEEELRCFDIVPEVDIVGGDIEEFIKSLDNIVGKRSVPATDKELKQYIKTRCPFNHMSVMFKKSVVESVGGYMDWFWNEDYYLWIRMYLNGSIFMNTSTTLVYVRVGKEMYQRRGGMKYFKSEIELQKFMKKNGIINYPTYFLNCIKRLIVQILLPNKLRGWVFQNFAREKV